MWGALGGDEFVAMLGGPVGAEEALRVADQLCQALAVPFTLSVGEVHVSASIGVALLPLHAAEESTLIHCADQAMYQAKAQGRNQAVLYAPVSPGAS